MCLDPIVTTNIKTSFLIKITVENVHMFTFHEFPSHTQSVERHVRLVSQISWVIPPPE